VLRNFLLEMDQLAEGLVECDLDGGALDVPLRLLVAPRQPQEQITRGGDPTRQRQVDEGAERVPEPAARKLRPEAQRRERGVLRLVQAVEQRTASQNST